MQAAHVPTGNESPAETNPPAGTGPAAQAQIQVSGPLPASEAHAVLALVQRAADADGVSPLSEHVMLQLRYGSDPDARNILLWSEGELAGYAHLDGTDPVEGPAGEMVIDPRLRRHGLGLALGRALAAEAGDGNLRLWAHGDLPAAAGLAAAVGFSRVRALWQMRRSLQTPIDEPHLPDGVSVRTFVVGADEDAWLALNHRAFAHHPEQGAWTRADLEMRERESWFDPDGFFLAERDGRLVGFHWTKVHGGNEPQPPTPAEQGHGREPIGEVYVVGVDTSERGNGLGRALTLVGLRYLRGRGLSQVMLYVDESNVAAIGLYQALGFTHWGTDVMFAASSEG
jgi:mycothiol synthase